MARPPHVSGQHERIHTYLLQSSRGATGPALLPAMAAMNHSHRLSGVLPRYMSGQRNHDVYEQPYRPQDRDAVLRLAEEAEGPESAALVAFWLDRAPDDFHVHHSRDTGGPVGFMAWLRLTEPADGQGTEEAAVDPVVATAWHHVRAAGPLRAGEHIALGRFMIYPPAYQRPSPGMDLVIQRILAEYLSPERRAWSFNVHPDPEFWRPLMTFIDHAQVPGTAVVGGRPYALFGHDWRAVPLETWLALMKSRQLGPPTGGIRPHSGTRSTLPARIRHGRP